MLQIPRALSWPADGMKKFRVDVIDSDLALTSIKEKHAIAEDHYFGYRTPGSVFRAWFELGYPMKRNFFIFFLLEKSVFLLNMNFLGTGIL
jgi:hypothetical protein